MCFIEEKHTFQDRTDMSCDFQPPFIEGEGEQYLRVIFSAVRIAVWCSSRIDIYPIWLLYSWVFLKILKLIKYAITSYY